MDADHAFPLLPPFFEANRWRTTESLLVARETMEETEELLLLSDDVVSSDSVVSSSDSEGGGGGIVRRKASSMRMIWLKLGRIAGSSTQHDCTMDASSWGVSSGKAGRTCCHRKQEKIWVRLVDSNRNQCQKQSSEKKFMLKHSLKINYDQFVCWC